MKRFYASLGILFLFFLFQPKIVKITPNEVLADQTPKNAPQVNFEPSRVRQYVAEQAKIYGLPVIDELWILSHESEDGTNLVGDDGNSLGYWMISVKYHPEVPTTCSMDLRCSTAWSLSFQKKNPKNINQWSTWACRYVWYKDATSTLGPAPKNYKTPKYCK